MTTAEPERGTCSSPPEPVCFDDAHNQDEAACVTGEVSPPPPLPMHASGGRLGDTT